MDPETSRRLFAEGAVVIVLDMPIGTEFGIDYTSWNIGPKFKGVKMIPAGSHFVFYSAVSSTKQGDGKDGRPKYTPANPGPRTGFFVHLKKQQILVKKWDPIHEELVDGATSEEELARFRMGLMDLDQFLGPYPFDNGLRRWLSLSSNITEDTIKNLAPLNGSICSVSTFVDSEDDGKAAADKETPTDNLRRTHDSVIRFSPIPRRCYPPNATAQEITRCSMDRSYTLEVLLNESSPAALLGELQFAFVCFLIGHVYDAFEQWKRFVALICQSEDAITKHSALFHDVIGVIHYQIREAPDDFFIDVISSNNFLVPALQNLFTNLKEIGVSKALRERGELFKQSLSRFNWDFEEEDDEEQPVVVGD